LRDFDIHTLSYHHNNFKNETLNSRDKGSRSI
jgi:hypothetical protein